MKIAGKGKTLFDVAVEGQAVAPSDPTLYLNLDVLKEPMDDRSPGRGFLWDENDLSVVRESDKQIKAICKIKSSDESSSDDAARDLSPESLRFMGRLRSVSEGGKSRRTRRSSANTEGFLFFLFMQFFFAFSAGRMNAGIPARLVLASDGIMNAVKLFLGTCKIPTFFQTWEKVKEPLVRRQLSLRCPLALSALH